MVIDSAPINLTHHFLIAMPGLQDQAFAKSVVYVCEHSERGALGLIINKPSDILLKGLFEKVDLQLARPDLEAAPVLQGGPVQTERGFVLHEAVIGTVLASPLTPEGEEPNSADAEQSPKEEAVPGVYASTLTIPGGLEMTTSRDVLEAMATGAGPRKVLVTLGYSAWDEGQLETELAENSWLTVAADPTVIFDTPIEERYDRALMLLGLQAWTLSPQAGRA